MIDTQKETIAIISISPYHANVHNFYLLTFVYKFCSVRAIPVWLVDNRCITIKVMLLPGHCPLHVKEAHSESKRKTKGKDAQPMKQNWKNSVHFCSKKPNKEAIKETQVAIFTSRSSHIDKLATDKTVLSEISSLYP